jgi:hypothetical protein
MVTQDTLDPIRGRLQRIEFLVLSALVTYVLFRGLVWLTQHLPQAKAAQVMAMTGLWLLVVLLAASYGWFLFTLLGVYTATLDIIVYRLTKFWRIIILVAAYAVMAAFVLSLVLVYRLDSLGDWGVFITVIATILSGIVFLHRQLNKSRRA